MLLTGLFMHGEALGIQMIVDADSESHSDSEYFTENDLDGDWDTTGATIITLNGDAASVDGKNAYVSGGNVVITGTGKYVISGTLDDGYISVNANANSKVWILFDGVTISCSDNACLIVSEADKVFLTLADGTENILTGGGTLSEEALSDGANGVIFAHDDLTINGSGALSIRAGYKHGIKANDDLVVTGGSLTIDAPADAIHVNDSFRLTGAVLDLTAGDDGIMVEKEDTFFYMEGGEITAAVSGDAIHSGGDITIAGGSVTLDAGDDALHADGNIEVSDGTILIESCYEGLEAKIITVSGGDITIYPTDDGFNANGGSSDMFGMGGPGGNMNMGGMGGPGGDMSGMQAPPDLSGMQEQTGTADGAEEESYILISGGTVTIINENGNDADGLDSNGSIYITGGDIRISLTNNGTNSAIDFGSESGGVCEISGGTVIACGSYSMAEAFDATSTQGAVLYNLSAGAESGTVLKLEDAAGNELLAWEVPCSFSSANISCPELEINGTYLMVIGNSEEEITLTDISASYGDAASGMFGGNMNWGGMRERGGRGRRGYMAEDTAQPPEGMEGMPQPPEGMEGIPEPPEGMGGMRHPSESGLRDEQSGEVQQAEGVTTESTLTAYPVQTYLQLAFCVLVLLAGIVFAARYRRNQGTR